MTSDVTAARSELRDRMRQARAAWGGEERAQADRAIVASLRHVLVDARTVAAFVPVRGEVGAVALWFDARTLRVEVALPRCSQGTGEMTFHRVEAWPTEGGAYGIPEPPTGAPRVAWEAIDAILVPGLAFDRAGHRLGYGAGYYDRALPRLRGDALRVGVCYGLQCVEEVPTAPHDVPVDLVVSDRFIIDARPAGRELSRP